MNLFSRIYLLSFMLILCSVVMAQTDSITHFDSSNAALIEEYRMRLARIEQQRLADSLKKAELETQLSALKTTDNLRKQELREQLRSLQKKEDSLLLLKKQRVNALRKDARGYPVRGVLNDTLFYIYAKIGASTPKDRADNISTRLEKLYDEDFLVFDSITTLVSENTIDIMLGETIIMSISETDALWYDMTMAELATEYAEKIRNSFNEARKEHSLGKLFGRLGLVLLIILVIWLIIRLIGRGYLYALKYIRTAKSKWLRDMRYRDYTFLSVDQEMSVLVFLIKVFRWFMVVLLLYFALPVIFSVFPFTRGWATVLFNLVWSPFKKILLGVWDYLPNVFTILVIYFVMRYFVKFVKYIFTEIKLEKLKITGFHSDWAMPTYNIVRFLLYAFMFVLIFPYLPGSDSNIFKGVSVFIGLLISLGSSSAIANMIAGLVITYMRPFKIGDRIQIGEIQGDVIEKTTWVTRIRTIKNEEVTIPNASVLTSSTTNYSAMAGGEGLILHATITIGYDVPWKKMHEALIEAALRTDHILKNPKPFVLQTSLDDFYVSYQINAYTREASEQAVTRSKLYENIQDVCNEKGIEIMSAHYNALRDGNKNTIPEQYLPAGYKSPPFNLGFNKKSTD